MHPVLDTLHSITVVNADRIAHELTTDLRKQTKEVQRRVFGGNPKVGYFYLYRRADMHPDIVMENVISPEVMDSITSLYKNAAPVADINAIVRTRETLIDALAKKIGMSHDAIGSRTKAAAAAAS